MVKKAPPIPQPGKLPELDKQATLEKIQPYLMLWLSIKKACNAYNVKTNWESFVSPSTVGMWYTEIEAVRDQIDAWRESPDMLAHKAWVDNLRTSNFQAAKAWLEVKDRETFGTKEDTTPRVIIEFATWPSPFVDASIDPNSHVSVPIKQPMPQSEKFHESQTKKKSVNGSKASVKGGVKPKTTSSTKKTARLKNKTWWRRKNRIKKQITIELHELRNRMNAHRP